MHTIYINRSHSLQFVYKFGSRYIPIWMSILYYLYLWESHQYHSHFSVFYILIIIAALATKSVYLLRDYIKDIPLTAH